MEIVSGMIVVWYGSSGTIPDGYYRCDGDNGTPDLRDRLPFCGDFIEAAGAVAGNWVHNHAGTTLLHHHEYIAGSGIAPGNDYDLETDEAEPTVTLNQNSSVLIGLGLHYIQKV